MGDFSFVAQAYRKGRLLGRLQPPSHPVPHQRSLLAWKTLVETVGRPPSDSGSDTTSKLGVFPQPLSRVCCPSYTSDVAARVVSNIEFLKLLSLERPNPVTLPHDRTRKNLQKIEARSLYQRCCKPPPDEPSRNKPTQCIPSQTWGSIAISAHRFRRQLPRFDFQKRVPARSVLELPVISRRGYAKDDPSNIPEVSRRGNFLDANRFSSHCRENVDGISGRVRSNHDPTLAP